MNSNLTEVFRNRPYDELEEWIKELNYAYALSLGLIRSVEKDADSDYSICMC